MDPRPEDVRAGNERTCIVTGQAGGRGDLLRFVLDPDDVVTLDLTHALPGRGAWVVESRRAVRDAAARGAFSRAFRRPARLPRGLDADGFADLVRSALQARAAAALGLARRAGDVVCGSDATQRALEDKRFAVGAILAASDASPAQADRLVGAGRTGVVLRNFTAAELSAALGNSSVVYAAVREGPQAERLRAECARLARYAMDGAPAAPANETGKAEVETK